jgi:hypothetical protein
MVKAFDLKCPMFVDALGNEVATKFNAIPERLYLLAGDGTVLFQGGEGPFDYSVAALETALKARVAGRSDDGGSKLLSSK